MPQSLTQQYLEFDTVEEYRKFVQARAQETNHMCGLMGFNPMLGDVCPRCDLDFLDRIAVDPDELKYYAPNHRIGTTRSKMMDEDMILCGICGEDGHYDDECDEAWGLDRDEYDIRDFLGRLEDFLESELDNISRGNVFLTENGDDNVSLNILIGAPFADHGDETLKQINVIIAPTDRGLLGTEGLTSRDGEDRPVEDETGDEDYRSPFDEAMEILD